MVHPWACPIFLPQILDLASLPSSSAYQRPILCLAILARPLWCDDLILFWVVYQLVACEVWMCAQERVLKDESQHPTQRQVYLARPLHLQLRCLPLHPHSRLAAGLLDLIQAHGPSPHRSHIGSEVSGLLNIVSS